jgi:hypothetical protein
MRVVDGLKSNRNGADYGRRTPHRPRHRACAGSIAVVLHVRRSNDEANGLLHKITEQCGRAHVVSGDLADAAAVDKSFLQPPHSGR